MNHHLFQRRDRSKWHSWYAWFPSIVFKEGDVRFLWLERVERKFCCHPGEGCYWVFRWPESETDDDWVKSVKARLDA